MASAKAPEGRTRTEILRLKKKGLTPRQIATYLGISTQGVHYHLKRMSQRKEKAS